MPRGGGPRGGGHRGGFGGPRHGGFHRPPPPPMHGHWHGHRRPYGCGCMGCLLPALAGAALLCGVAALLVFLL